MTICTMDYRDSRGNTCKEDLDMGKYVIKNSNQKYYNGRTWVSRNAAETFDWYNADNTARELRYAGVDAVVEEK